MADRPKLLVLPNDDGKYTCHYESCQNKYTLFNSLHQHYRRHYSDVTITKSVARTPKTREEKQQKQRQYNKKRKKKRQQEAKKIRASKALIILNRPYSYEDAETYGKYIESDTHFKLVECKKSEIEGAGIGVFACVDLEVDDIVTFYTGTFVKEEPKDRKAVEYSIAVKRTPISFV